MRSLPSKNRVPLFRLAVWLWLACLLCGCDGQTACHTFCALPARGWRPGDTLRFDAVLPDSLRSYRLQVEVRHRGDYPYRNLLLAVSHEAPATPLRTDTLQLFLADGQGIWIGKGMGGLYQHAIPIEQWRIAGGGTHTFRILHLLPDSLLRGISDVGIKLTTGK